VDYQQHEAEALASAFPQSADPAPYKFLAQVRRPRNDGHFDAVRVIRGHDEGDAHHAAREKFPDAIAVKVQRLDTLQKLRRPTYTEARAVLLFGVAESKGVDVDALTFGVDYDNIRLDETAFRMTQDNRWGMTL
jgi:hypothetical protein